MAITYGQFVGEFEEFSKLSPARVEAKLAEARRSFDQEVLGARYDDAVKYQAAVLLASSPHGRPQAMTKDKATPYDNRLAEILASVRAKCLPICPGA